ncbi:16S rRNA (cytosine(1402)-N(4))-methyltransferase [Actinoplanes sp. ATCC 53533]|uniref:class I SAM-dependent methyltransferase n=1 Tax=Actinoplanes sp. ATCC 53533 TaxID=1288362 RepID=UPI000F7860B6|nr:class I SAM-dependent methyltransferase [Actinoplanes sp. ATCC 53533]RSM39572.1 16S rRNA (cytosine(1402)-N(4))-methyltransferase [Actinoplanes sp. ATCC 53533]
MLMNQVETALINSPPRRWLQRWYEVPWLRRLGGPLPPDARVLEIGCGPGYGTRLILEQFGAAHVDAIDLDPAMIARARRRLAGHGDRVRLHTGDAADLHTSVGAPDAGYDAVFDFAIVHHIPAWRTALAEIARVLRPGGRFYFDEVTARVLARPTYRALFDHPTTDRFTADDFRAELHRHGLHVGDRWRAPIGGDYLIGVAERR